MSYLINSDTPPASATLTLSVNDQGNTGSGGALTASDSATLNITAVNDAPTATITPTSYTATEQTSLTLHGTGLSVTDADAGASSVQATLSVTAGALTVSAGTTGVTVSGSGSASVTLTGTVTQVNNLLAGLNGGTVSYLINSDTPPASATLTLSVNDQGNTGSGGALTASDAATLNIAAVNDAPIVNLNLGVSVPQGQSVTVSNSRLRVADADHSPAQLTYTLNAATSHGALTKNGVTLSLGDTFTQADVDSGLIAYAHDNSLTPSDQFSVTVLDAGGASTGSITFDITINSTNTAPTILHNQTVSVNEGQTVAITSADLSAQDTEESASDLVYAITSIPTHGQLMLNGVTLDVSDTFSQQDIDDGRLSYQHGDGEVNSDTFVFRVEDGRGGELGPLSFNLSIAPVNDAPSATVTPGLVSEGAARTIDNSMLQASDADDAVSSLTLTVSALPAHGSLALRGIALQVGDSFNQADIDQGDLVYQHNGGEDTLDQFWFTVSDGRATSAPVALTLQITPVNDVPVIQITQPFYTAQEQQALNLHGTGISVSDADANTGDVEVRVSVVSGTLSVLTGASGVQATQTANNSITLVGTIARINDLLAGVNGAAWVYNAASDAPPVSDTLTLQINDQGQTGTGGPQTASASVGIVVTPINDAPSAQISQTSYTAIEQLSLQLHGTGLSVSDPDAGGNVIQATVSVGAGRLTANAGSTGVLIGNSGSSVTLTGTLLQINAFLAGLNGAELTYLIDTDAPPSEDTLSLTVDDQGQSGQGVALTASSSVRVIITALNDAPSVSMATPTYGAQEQMPLTLQGTGMSLNDPDALNAVVEATLSVNAGVLTVTSGGTGVVVNGNETNTVRLTGSVAQLNALLAGGNGATVTYRIDTDDPVTQDTLTLTLNDLGGRGQGGALSSSQSSLITIEAINDAPTITAPATYTTTEQTLLALHGTGVMLSDPDAGSTPVRLTLIAAQGSLSINVGTTGVSAIGSGSNTVVLDGSLAQLNALLAGLNGGTLTHLTSGDAPPTTDSLTWTLDDRGHSGTGAGTPVTVTSPININALNDAPAATIVPTAYNAVEQVPLNLQGSGLQITDADAGNLIVQATLGVVSGTLIASAGSTGVAVSGSGTANLSLTGTVDQINALLQGLSSATVQYLNNSDTPAATDTLTLRVDDQGHSGSGGALTASDSALINVQAVNDAPQVVVPGTYTATEQIRLSLHATGMALNDVDTGGATVQATLSVQQGQLFVDAGTTGTIVSGQGSSTLTFTGTLTQINAMLAGDGNATLQYLNPSEAPGSTDALTLSIDDGTALASASATIVMASVNDAPSITASNAPYTATEQTALALQGTGLSASDPDAGTSSLLFILSVEAGSIQVQTGGTGVTTSSSPTGDTMAIQGTLSQLNRLLSGLDGATLTYTPLGDTPPAQDTLTLRLSDEGHNGLGGTQFVERTLSITISAVHDAPLAQDDRYITPEGSALTLTPDMLLGNDSSPEGLTLTADIVSMPTQGTLTQNPDGTWRYQPSAGFVGQDTFRYRVGDGVTFSNEASVSIRVEAPPAIVPPGVTIPPLLEPSDIAPLPADQSSNSPDTLPVAGQDRDTLPSDAGEGPNTAPDGTAPHGGALPDDELGGAPGLNALQGVPSLSDAAKVSAPTSHMIWSVRLSDDGRQWLPRGDSTLIEWASLPQTEALTALRQIPLSPIAGPSPFTSNWTWSPETTRSVDDLVLNFGPQIVQMGSLALSVGAVWWISRSAALLSSLLLSTPIWRRIDPMPVLAGQGQSAPEGESSMDRHEWQSEQMFDDTPARKHRWTTIG